MTPQKLEEIRSRCYEVTAEHSKALDDLIEFCIRYGFEKAREKVLHPDWDYIYESAEQVIQELEEQPK